MEEMKSVMISRYKLLLKYNAIIPTEIISTNNCLCSYKMNLVQDLNETNEDQIQPFY